MAKNKNIDYKTISRKQVVGPEGRAGLVGKWNFKLKGETQEIFVLQATLNLLFESAKTPLAKARHTTKCHFSEVEK